MDKKALAVLGLAIFFAAITAYAVSRVLKQQATGIGASEMQKVVVAVAPITLGQRITPDQVTLEEFPKGSLPTGIMDDVSQVVDRVSLAEVTIREPILKVRLAPPGSPPGLAAALEPGMRAIAVKVDEVIGVAGFVAPGHYVDVVATIRESGGESSSRTILQHVKVMAVGTETETKDGQPVQVKTVTLQVLPGQAEALALASTAGRLQLVMRNSVDQEEVVTRGIDTEALLRGHVRPAPRRSAPVRRAKPTEEPPPPPPAPTVEVIKGTERSTVTFNN